MLAHPISHVTAATTSASPSLSHSSPVRETSEPDSDSDSDSDPDSDSDSEPSRTSGVAVIAAAAASSSTVEMDASDSEMTDALEDEGGVAIGPYLDPHYHSMEAIMQQLGDATGFTSVDSTASDNNDDDMADQHRRLVYSGEELSVSGVESSSAPWGLQDILNGHGHVHSNLSEVDIDDFYRAFNYDALPQLPDTSATPGHDDHAYSYDDNSRAGLGADDHFPASVVHGTTSERNLTVDQFIDQWLIQPSSTHLRYFLPPKPSIPQRYGLALLNWAPPPRILRPSRYPDASYDIQQIPWWEVMRVKRPQVRALRDACYTSYHNLEYSPRFAQRLPNDETFFRGKSMHTKHRATIEHFQLRNLMSVVSHNTVEFAHESKLYSWVPGYDDLVCLIDLSKPSVESCFQCPVKISTMSSRHGVSIAGGFCGEYALRAAGTDEPAAEGYVTKDFNGITTHIDIVKHRTSRSPTAIIASNDKHLRVLDCESNQFVADYALSCAVNCTATSPDGRLRAVVGDSPDAWVIEADTGRPVHPLRGHRDFGFACAWSPDMRHIATGNQDKTVIIWDARTWRILETIESDVAGYRSLRFSPVGGGPRTLLLCEPADRIAIVDAQTYQSRQVHDFFGEIGGADYTPDGGAIWVANTDQHFGGFMEYERWQWGKRLGLSNLPNEWLPESALENDERCVLSARERQMRFCRNLTDEEHDELLLA